MKSWRQSATVFFSVCLLMPSLGAQAAPIGSQAASAVSSGAAQLSPLVDARYRHRGHYRHHSYRHYHHHDSGGAVAAGAIIGLAAGAILAGAASHANANVAYCSQRFRSYDPASGTYLGYDGYRHPCP
jgi:hypothetical protein